MSKLGVHVLVRSVTWDAAEHERTIAEFSMDLAVQARVLICRRPAIARDAVS